MPPPLVTLVSTQAVALSFELAAEAYGRPIFLSHGSRAFE